MLKFMRNKIVGVELKDENTLVATGTLADDMYGMRLEVTVRRSDLAITAINGSLDRYTTPECTHADDFLQEAVGFRVDAPEFGRQVHRTIWRRSCQHYASLLEDCGESLRQAATVLGHKPDDAIESPQSRQKPPPATTAAVPATPSHPPASSKAPLDHAGHGFVIDLHLHTAPASACASDPVDDMINEAKRIGLDAICLTDHNHVWQQRRVEELRAKHDFVLLRGNEITTDQGDMLVFGFYQDIRGIIPLTDLRSQVLEAGGIMIAAHPFRGFLTFGVGQLGLTVDAARQRPLFKMVDGIEIRNGKVTDEENRFAEEVAEALGLPALAGSDAHQVSEVGRYATRFNGPVENETALIAAIKEGRYEVLAFREHLQQGGS